MSVKLNLRIKDEKLVADFKKYVIEKHGGLYAAFGIELAQAMKMYLAEKGIRPYARAHTSYRRIQRDKVFDKLLEKLAEIAQEKVAITESELQPFITRTYEEVVGYPFGDSRTYKKYKNQLLAQTRLFFKRHPYNARLYIINADYYKKVVDAD